MRRNRIAVKVCPIRAELSAREDSLRSRAKSAIEYRGAAMLAQVALEIQKLRLEHEEGDCRMCRLRPAA